MYFAEFSFCGIYIKISRTVTDCLASLICFRIDPVQPYFISSWNKCISIFSEPAHGTEKKITLINIKYRSHSDLQILCEAFYDIVNI
jgi:hypothetical protein